MSEITMEALMRAKEKEMEETLPAQEPAEEALTPQERQRVDEIKKEIDFLDPQTDVQYGVGAQRNIADFSQRILGQVRTKDSGTAGELLLELSEKVRNSDVAKIGNNEGILDKIPFLKSAKDRIRRFQAQYETLEVQVDRIEGELEKARMEMLKDINMFETLYQKNLEYFRELECYITAGEEKVAEVRQETLPGLRQEAAESGDPMAAQVLRDFEDTVNRFEKKLHDMKLSRTIAIQTAPQIKMIQNNDKMLVDKIQTAVLNTIPVWKSQIVIALGLYRQQKTLQMQREITDTTNQLLEKNAELLKTNTLETAKESERGIADIATLKKVNDDMIRTIEETLRIQREGSVKRHEAEKELARLEADMKRALAGQFDQR
ncbi:MAG TPA: toxic anion resistance protein [Candidatus Dorea merdavium]|uniref:toxic anion resistance protein n=1 Tax=Massilistercora timonensis TaxID=2086584 RepID=UPI001F85FBB8|nr:toxic anion resistance protein [Candidatus Dorea merdavium]